MVYVTPRSTPIERSDPGPISMLSPPGYVGHAHFWERALSRRAFLGAAAGASALAATASVAWPAVAFAESEHNAAPRPIPGGTPVIGQEVSTITDFKGSLAAAEIQGSGVDNKGTTLTYDADMRFMSGEYVALDGRRHEGTFAFV